MCHPPKRNLTATGAIYGVLGMTICGSLLTAVSVIGGLYYWGENEEEDGEELTNQN